MASDYVGWAGVIATLALGLIAYWVGRYQKPKSEVRITDVALVYSSIGDGTNKFISRITNHGSAFGEIVRTEVQATVDGLPVTARLCDKDIAGIIGASESKQLWLQVEMPEPVGTDVHEGRKRLRVTVTPHPKKGKALRSSFDFSRDPGYGFVPSAIQ